MTANRQQLRETITHIVTRLGTAIRFVMFELVSSSREAFLFARRLTIYALDNVQRWRLNRKIAALDVLIGESALATGQGDDSLRLELSNITSATLKDRALREKRKRLLRLLAKDVSGRVAAGETAELLRLRSIEEASASETTARLVEQWSLLIPRENPMRRRAVAGPLILFAIGIVGFSLATNTSASRDADDLVVSANPLSLQDKGIESASRPATESIKLSAAASIDPKAISVDASPRDTTTVPARTHRQLTDPRPVNFVDELKAAGFQNASAWNVRQFVQHGTREAATARMGNTDEEFVESNPRIANSVYELTLTVESDRPGFDIFGPRHVSKYVQVKLPFRVTFDRRGADYEGAIIRAVPYLASHTEAWFLTKDGQLSRCNSATERSLVVRNNGILYLPEDVSSSVMIELAEQDVGELAIRGRLGAKVVFERLHSEKPTVWGYYKVESLARELSRYDCEAIRDAFDIGLDIDAAPSYFAPDKGAPVHVIAATLRSVEISKDGAVLGAARLHK